MNSSMEHFHEIAVGDVMHRGLLSCAPETPLHEVADLMVREGIHCVLVVPSDDKERGGNWRVVSDLDLVAAAETPWLTARDISTTPTITVGEADRAPRAAALMSEFESAHLIVVDALAHPVGVVSTLDIARAISAGSAAEAASGAPG